jgi:hypothetical protein
MEGEKMSALKIEVRLQHPKPVRWSHETPRQWRGVAVCTYGGKRVARVVAMGPSAARISSSLIRECCRLWDRQRRSTMRTNEPTRRPA